MASTLIPVEVTIDYATRGPQVIRATDSDDPHATEHRTRGKASTELLQEVFAKILEHRRTGKEIKLSLDDDGFIIKDSGFSVPDASTHLEAARTATTAVHDALNALEEVVAPPAKGRRRSTSKKRPT